MQSLQEKVQLSCLELQQDIFRYFERLSEAEEFFKKKATDSYQRVKYLETLMRQAEEKQAQLNNQWVPLETARNQSVKKIYENLLGQNAVCQRLEQQMSQPSYHTYTYEQKDGENVSSLYNKVLSEQEHTHSKI